MFLVFSFLPICSVSHELPFNTHFLAATELPSNQESTISSVLWGSYLLVC